MWLVFTSYPALQSKSLGTCRLCIDSLTKGQHFKIGIDNCFTNFTEIEKDKIKKKRFFFNCKKKENPWGKKKMNETKLNNLLDEEFKSLVIAILNVFNLNNISSKHMKKFSQLKAKIENPQLQSEWEF